MFNNYRYFLVLAEEQNITRAANKLFISHQSLSTFIKNLESEYDTTFFDRKQQFALTPAGKAMFNCLREVERLENNFLSEISNINNEETGTIKFGTTEGRYRIIVPHLLKEYKAMYPNVKLMISNSTSLEMEKKLLNNEIDMFFGLGGNMSSNRLQFDTISEEKLYLLISDNLLKKYFPDTFPQCKEEFKKGADIKLFKDVPFILNKPNFTSRIMIEKHLAKINVNLNCILELTQPDIHHLLCAVDYGASFCLSMYVPSIFELNVLKQYESELNIFPIFDFTEKNYVCNIYLKNKIFPKYAIDLMKLTKKLIHELMKW